MSDPRLPAPGSRGAHRDAQGADDESDSGLPRGFRMRHDRSFVDRLSAADRTIPVRMVPLERLCLAEPPSLSPTHLAALTRSIREYGLLQPLLVRPVDDGYEVLDGAARFAACRRAGLREVPVLVHSVDRERAERLRAELAIRASAAGLPAAGTGEDLRQSLRTVLSCIELLGSGPGPLLERAGLDLVIAEARRSLWLLEAAEVLATSPSVSPRPLAVAELLARELDVLEPEIRLLGLRVRRELRGRSLHCWADEPLLHVGLASMLRAGLQLASGQGVRALCLRSGAYGGHRLLVELAQEPQPFTQLSGPWSLEGPGFGGGARATAHAFEVARRVAELHEGSLVLADAEQGGFALRLSLPATEVDVDR